jgi:LPXTG-motif cell wall-anchored protein
MVQTSDIANVIGFAATNHQGEMVAILTRNGVIVPTETLTTKMLVELIVNALAESPSFAKDFAAWAGTKASAYSSFTGPLLPDGSTTSGGDGFDWGKLLGNVAKAGAQVGNYIQGKQQATAAQALAAAEQAKLDAARIAAENEEKSFASKLALSQAGTTKVVIFGLVGLAAIGGAIWYFTRKK